MQPFLRWLGEHFGTLLLAFILAVAVWISAVVSADPNEQRTMRSIRLEVIGQPSDLVVVGQVADQVRVTLRAPTSIWDQLADNPNLVKAWIDLTGLEPGEHNVVVKTQVDLRPIRFVSVEPGSVVVRVEPLVRREIPVQLTITGELPLGYRQGDPQVQPDQIVVSGPESAVTRLAQARAEINISGSVETIRRTIPVDFIDEAGQPVPGLSVSSKQVSVIQPINLLGRFKNVAVKVVTSGQVANGYRLTNISVSPPTFTVFSEDPELINEIPGFVETLPIDLNNLADDAAVSVDLNLPEAITTVREPSVMVQVSVAAIEGSLTLSLPVEVEGLDSDLHAIMSPQTVDVIVAGPLFVLDGLTVENFLVIVDLTGLPPGVYQRTAVVELAPEQVRIQTTLPETVEVTIEIAPTPTASPINPSPTLTSTPTPTPTLTPTGRPTLTSPPPAS